MRDKNHPDLQLCALQLVAMAKSQLSVSATNTTPRPYSFNVQPFMADNNLAQQGYLTSEPYADQGWRHVRCPIR